MAGPVGDHRDEEQPDPAGHGDGAQHHLVLAVGTHERDGRPVVLLPAAAPPDDQSHDSLAPIMPYPPPDSSSEETARDAWFVLNSPYARARAEWSCARGVQKRDHAVPFQC